MLRSVALLVLATSTVHATPELGICADRAIAALPERDRQGPQSFLPEGRRRPGLDEREQRALADATTERASALLQIVEAAALAGDRARVARLVKQMQLDAKAARPSSYEPDNLKREARLARALALAGQVRPAISHFQAARSYVPKIHTAALAGAHRELLMAAIALRDDALVKAQEAAFFAAILAKDQKVQARFLAYDGEGRRALRLVEGAGDHHDSVLAGILEGTIARKNSALSIEILSKLRSARARLMHLESVCFAMPASERRLPAFVAATKAALAVENAPEVDDYARGVLVTVLVEVGLAQDAVAVASRIRNPWARAAAEATAADGLALVDRSAAIELAQRAVKRAATPGERKDVENDKVLIERTKTSAVSALARAGQVDEAKKLGKPHPVDIAIGLRDRPPALEAWWTHASPHDRAIVLAAGAGEYPPLGDPGFLQRFCP